MNHRHLSLSHRNCRPSHRCNQIPRVRRTHHLRQRHSDSLHCNHKIPRRIRMNHRHLSLSHRNCRPSHRYNQIPRVRRTRHLRQRHSDTRRHNRNTPRHIHTNRRCQLPQHCSCKLQHLDILRLQAHHKCRLNQCLIHRGHHSCTQTQDKHSFQHRLSLLHCSCKH